MADALSTCFARMMGSDGPEKGQQLTQSIMISTEALRQSGFLVNHKWRSSSWGNQSFHDLMSSWAQRHWTTIGEAEGNSAATSQGTNKLSKA